MAQFQRKFGLYELDWSYAAELQCTLMEKQIGMKISLMEAERRKARMQKHLKQANTKLLEMEKYSIISIAVRHILSEEFVWRFFSFAARIQQESKPQSDIDRLMREANHEINGFTEKNVRFKDKLIYCYQAWYTAVCNQNFC